MIVGPASCRHCDRAIYPSGNGWVHGNGRAVCYSGAGVPLDAEPRANRPHSGATEGK